MTTVVFPAAADGKRSSTALGRAVVADALQAADPAAAEAARHEPDWRRGYLRHFRALIEAGLPPEQGYAIARAGLASVHQRMRAGEQSIAGWLTTEVDRPLRTITVDGTGKPEQELTLPYERELLRGDSLHRRLDDWVAAGTIEESAAEAVREVAANPGWLDLSDQRLVVLGAGAEMGPLPAVLGWGGTVLGIDLPRPELWARVTRTAEQSAGRLIAPEKGADLLTDLPAIAEWLLRTTGTTGGDTGGRLVVGNYVYAPGGAYPRLSAAADALAVHLVERRPGTALAFLATPTDVFAVPGGAVTQANDRYRQRGRSARVAGSLSGGRMLQPNYPEGADPGIADSLVPQQGPNYALAKHIQRWRASVTRQDGGAVSFAVAPPTNTRSVTNNRLLAAAYAGAHIFGVEVFAPATANKLMAALLVHQLRNPRPASPQVWRDEAVQAAHGGLWRVAYRSRSALGLAALRGLPKSR